MYGITERCGSHYHDEVGIRPVISILDVKLEKNNNIWNIKE